MSGPCRRARRAAAAVLALLWSSGAWGQTWGRSLAEALAELRRAGLPLVFSSDLVTPELRQRTPARPGLAPEAQAEEWLRPHGLRLERGPRGRLLVVRAPHAALRSEAGAPALRPELRLRLSTPPGRELAPGLPVTVNGRELERTLGSDGDVLLGELEAGAYLVLARTRELQGSGQVRLDGGGPRELDLALVERSPAEAAEAPTPGSLVVTVSPLAELSEAIQVRAGVVLFDSGAAAVRVHPGDLGRLTGGAENAVRAAQTLAGVVAIGPNTAGFVVRGGEPDQNLFVLDGVEIHNPYPFTLLVNPFDAAVLERYELHTGPLPARYGDRLSSALVLDLRPGSFERRLAGSVGLGVLEGDVVLEGRLPGRKRASWLAAARGFNYRLLAEALPLEPGDDAPPALADVQAKLVFEPGPGQLLSLQGLRSRDVFAGTPEAEQSLLSLRWRSSAGPRAYWTLQASAYATHDADTQAVELVVPNERLESDRVGGQSEVHDLRLTDLALAGDAARQAGAHALSGGFRVQHLRTRLDWLAPWYLVEHHAPERAALRPGEPAMLTTRFDRVRLALWGEDRWSLGPRLGLGVGLRFERSAPGLRQLDPRLSLALALDSRTRLRLAAARQHQSPGFEKLLQRRTTNQGLWTDSEPSRLVDPAALAGLPAESADQVSLGLERLLGDGFGLRVEGYHKKLGHLIYGRLETEAERLARLARYDFPPELQAALPSAALPTRHAVGDGRGRVWGLEATLTRPTESVDQRLSGWLGYSWTHSRRSYAGVSTAAAFERRHVLSGALHLGLGPRWQLAGAGWLASGAPFFGPGRLRPAGLLDRLDSDRDGRRDELLPRLSSAGFPVGVPSLPAFEQGRRGRLPLLARVDMRLTHQPRGPQGRWSFYIEGLNLLNQHTPSAISYGVNLDPATGRYFLVTRPLGAITRVGFFGARFRF